MMHDDKCTAFSEYHQGRHLSWIQHLNSESKKWLASPGEMSLVCLAHLNPKLKVTWHVSFSLPFMLENGCCHIGP